MGSKSIEFGPNFVKFKCNLLPVKLLCAFEYHMFKKMRDAYDMRIIFIARASADIIRHRDRLKIGHRLTNNLQTITQSMSMKYSAIGSSFRHVWLLLLQSAPPRSAATASLYDLFNCLYIAS